MQLNLIKLEATVAAAKAKAADSPTWLRAIEKAHTHLIENPYISRTEDGLLILSTSGKTYHSNGVCQCEAFTYGRKPCWHRAAAKLVERYIESETPAPKASDPRAEMITAITASWSRNYNDAQIAAGLTRRFGVNTLLALSTGIIEQIHHQVCLRS